MAEDTLLTFCPPAPWARMADSSTSSSQIWMSWVTGMGKTGLIMAVVGYMLQVAGAEYRLTELLATGYGVLLSATIITPHGAIICGKVRAIGLSQSPFNSGQPVGPHSPPSPALTGVSPSLGIPLFTHLSSSTYGGNSGLYYDVCNTRPRTGPASRT